MDRMFYSYVGGGGFTDFYYIDIFPVLFGQKWSPNHKVSMYI